MTESNRGVAFDRGNARARRALRRALERVLYSEGQKILQEMRKRGAILPLLDARMRLRELGLRVPGEN